MFWIQESQHHSKIKRNRQKKLAYSYMKNLIQCKWKRKLLNIKFYKAALIRILYCVRQYDFTRVRHGLWIGFRECWLFFFFCWWPCLCRVDSNFFSFGFILDWIFLLRTQFYESKIPNIISYENNYIFLN